MPMKWFICPDGQRVEKVKCLLGKCRMNARCAPLVFLQLAGREREWKGTPSVTQLIDGTRRQMLMLTTDYAIHPEKAAYRVLGTRGHTSLETANGVSFSEEHFDDGEIMGTSDLLEQQEDGSWWLIDHKTTGSYKVAKAIGLVKCEKMLIDDNGNPRKHKNGKPVKETWYEIDESERDVRDWQLQLNKYRLMAEQALGEKIGRMKIFCVVRDGGTYIAKGRGIGREIYYIDIPAMPDEEVNTYFNCKREALLSALKTLKTTECTGMECWDGNKCKICEVSDACAKMGRSWTVEGEDE